MINKGLIVYSSKTGNTKKVATGIHEHFKDQADLAAVEKASSAEQYDWLLIGFWVDRGTADKKMLDYLENLANLSIGFFGTLGAYPDSGHAGDVRERLKTLISEKNRYLGGFLCQGKIDPALSEKFKQFPADHPHAMTKERLKRHQDASSHPDNQDIRNACDFCVQMLKQLRESENAR